MKILNSNYSGIINGNTNAGLIGSSGSYSVIYLSSVNVSSNITGKTNVGSLVGYVGSSSNLSMYTINSTAYVNGTLSRYAGSLIGQVMGNTNILNNNVVSMVTGRFSRCPVSGESTVLF